MDSVAIISPPSYFVSRQQSPINLNPVIPDFSEFFAYNESMNPNMNTNTHSNPESWHTLNNIAGGYGSSNAPRTMMPNTQNIGAYPPDLSSFSTRNFYESQQRPFAPPYPFPPRFSDAAPVRNIPAWGSNYNYPQGAAPKNDPVNYSNSAQPSRPLVPPPDSDPRLKLPSRQAQPPNMARIVDSRGSQPSKDDEENLPYVHTDFGVWPGNFKSCIQWDLSHPEKLTRANQPLPSSLLNSSIIRPAQSKMIITFEKAPNMSCTITSPSGPGGEITLQHLINCIARMLHNSVTYEYWRRSPIERRQDIVRAWGRRHPGEPAPWGLNRFGVMDAWEVQPGLTGFECMDVLGRDVIFLGFMMGQRENEWIMKTKRYDWD